MSESDEMEFKRLLQSVGDKLSDLQTKGIAEICGIPSRLYNNGAELLLLLNKNRQIRPENVDILRKVLEENHAGADALKLVADYTASRPSPNSAGSYVGRGRVQTPSVGKSEHNVAVVTSRETEGGEGQRQSVLSNNPPTIRKFIEREDIATALIDRAKPPPSKNGATEYYALVAEGGAGKTQMSLWFCEQMKERALYDLVWFMSGDGPERFAEDLEDLMDELEIEYQEVPPKKLKRTLARKLNERGKWLIVVDNFEGISLREIEERIPERGGTVLLTSRDLRVLPSEDIVEVKPFSDEETMRLFERILGNGNVEESLVQEVGELLGHNAFALSVCAYYLHESTIDANESAVRVVKEKFQDLIGKLKDKKKDETVREMYEHSLRKLEEKSPESWRMMKKLSLLSAEGVSREVVRKILKGKVVEEEMEKKVKEIKELMSSGKRLEALMLNWKFVNASVALPIAPTDSCEEYTTKESDLMSEILRLGLAEKRGDKYYVHRLMMKVVQERMNHTGEFTSVLEEVIEDIHRMWIEDSSDHTRWKKIQEMGEHVVSLAIHLEHFSSTMNTMNAISTKSREQLVWRLYDYSYYTIEVKGDYTTAEERITKAEQVEGGGKCSKKVRASLKNVRGNLNDKQGKYAEAITEYREALEMEEEESRKASKYNNIGICLTQLKKYPEALEEYEKSLKIDMKYKGENSIEVSTTMDNMGICLTRMGSYEEALEKHRRALEIRLDKYGEVNPLVAHSYNNIGSCYTDMEKYEDALEMHEKALEIRRKVYGEECHPKVAGSLHNVGLDKRILGRVEEAKPHLEGAYRIHKRMLGEDHPDTINTKRILDKCNE